MITPEDIRQLDPKDVYGSTKMFAAQCQQMLDEWYDNPDLLVPEDYKNIKNIVICGMGGSAYGAHVTQSLYSNVIRVPVIPLSDYHMPAFVDAGTLVILTSYSGTTEEVLSCMEEATSRGAKLAGLTTGGVIKEALSGKYPIIVFDPKNNPSTQPRLGTGYIVVGTLLLLHRLGIINITREELQSAIDEVKSSENTLESQAGEMATSLEGHIPLVFAAEHLVGNAHIIRNQFNETSKSFAAFQDIPELNHHLMEGLKNPQDKKMKAIFLVSENYSEKHAKRIRLTIDVVEQNNIPTLAFDVTKSSKIAEVLAALSFGGFLTLHLAFIYKLDPSLIPWVEYFKQELARKN